jgi:Adenylate and Guanylate cyclase catalytic domain/SAM domain (Sterile alpha motif)
MDLRTLLRNQGLERFEAAFRDNGIDESVLPHLTQDHLRELGLALGARIKLLAAIAALPRETEKQLRGSVSVEASQADSAERRQITVLFSDLVGSTALSTRMDPEDLRKLISAYQKCVAETVRRFGGFVAKYMGDGVLVYFGYPEAHEDDAERAVRSALDLVAEVAKLNTGTPLQTRRHRHGSGRGRRSRRLGTGPGAGHSWRDAEPGRPAARACRARYGRDRRCHQAAYRQSF